MSDSYNYIVTTPELRSIANAIRNRYQTNDKILYPDGFINAINMYKNYIEGNISELYCPTITSINSLYFYGCKSTLTSIYFPACVNIQVYAFSSCYSLTTALFPNCTSIEAYAFAGCSCLTTISFPNCGSIMAYAFRDCTSLMTASFPKCNYLSNFAFYGCTKLTSVYFLGPFVPSLGSGVFSNTPISLSTYLPGSVYGSIYVPSSLYATYLTATNWSLYSARFVSV